MKTIKLTLLAFLFGCSIYSLNAQLKVHSDGSVGIGNGSQLGVRYILSTDTIIRYVGITGPGGPVTPPRPIITNKSVMAVVPFSSTRTSIGRSNNPMNIVYSKYFLASGSFVGVVTNSDIKLKTNIRKLYPISEKILKLNPVTYDFVKTSNGEDVSEDPFYKNRTGFIAQEVAEIFPDLVLIGDNNMHSLDYAGLIPYLTKAFQEQSQVIEKQSSEINELRKQMHDIQQGIYTADFIIEGEASYPNKAPQKNESDNMLFQNSPNPFNNSTTIKYQLSNNATNAKICIYNLIGKQLQCHNLPATKGESSIEVRASSLQTGMYLYSLIVDDKLIATKRMILTE